MKRTLLGLWGLMGTLALASCQPQPPNTATRLETPSPTPIATTAPGEASPSPTEAATTPLEITAQGIGPAKLGMTFGQLKQALPEATFEVKKPFIVDFDAIAVQQGGQTLFHILYPAGETLTDSSPIQDLMTEHPNARTAQGIGPGTPLSQAEAAYGRATLAYNLDNEGREYVRFANAPIPRLAFRLGAYGDNSLRGIYGEGEGGYYETNRYKEDATIQWLEISCVPDECPKSQN